MGTGTKVEGQRLTLSLHRYLELNRKLQIAVLGKYDEIKGAELARRDWKIDSQGHSELDFAKFTLSWFQLADMWTKRVDEGEYYNFLCELIRRMIEVGDDGYLKFKDDDQILSRKMYVEGERRPE